MSTNKNIKDMNIAELKDALKALETKKGKGKNLTALESFQYDMIPALITEKEKVVELQSKVKTSAKREVKAPDGYDILQPLFVTLRGAINKEIKDNDTLINLFEHSAKVLSVPVDGITAERLFNKTVQHNSVSNIAKADTKASAEGRKQAYLEMVEQAKIILPILLPEFWKKSIDAYNIAFNAAVSKLKK